MFRESRREVTGGNQGHQDRDRKESTGERGFCDNCTGVVRGSVKEQWMDQNCREAIWAKPRKPQASSLF